MFFVRCLPIESFRGVITLQAIRLARVNYWCP